MKPNNTYYLSIIVASLLMGCGGGDQSNSSNGVITNSPTTSQQPQSDTTTNTNTPSVLTVQCKTIDPILSQLNAKYAQANAIQSSYKESDDNEKDDEKDDEKNNENDNNEESENEGSSATGIHNQGIACLQCHSFASGATVFTRLNAPNKSAGAVGYKIQLGGSYVYNDGRGSGNSNLVRYSGGKFTANVINAHGNIVNSSANMSHDASRLDCNRCHTASGANGAPGRIINKRITTTTVVPASVNTTTCVSFSKNVMPILLAKCKTCHGSNGRFSIGSTNATYTNIAALQSPIKTAAQYLLNKGSNTINHGGGAVISGSSNEYKTIKAWVAEGALNN